MPAFDFWCWGSSCVWAGDILRLCTVLFWYCVGMNHSAVFALRVKSMPVLRADVCITCHGLGSLVVCKSTDSVWQRVMSPVRAYHSHNLTWTWTLLYGSLLSHVCTSLLACFTTGLHMNKCTACNHCNQIRDCKVFQTLFQYTTFKKYSTTFLHIFINFPRQFEGAKAK